MKDEEMTDSPRTVAVGVTLARVSSTVALLTGIFVGLLFYLAWCDITALFDVVASDVTIIGALVLSGIGVLLGVVSMGFSRCFSLLATVGAGASLAFGLFLLVPVLKEPPYPNISVSGPKMTLQLRTALSTVSRVEVHPVAHGDDTTFETIIVTKPEDIRNLVYGIVAVGRDGMGVRHCMCEGLLDIRFFSGTNLVTGFTYHHGLSLRLSCPSHYWDGGDWDGNIDMTKESQVVVREWLANHGIPNNYLASKQETE